MEEKKEEKKELPKTGGSTASLFALGAGALLLTGGLLIRRFTR
jgi:LPXTG-motif cell wall-anchored protein